MKRSVEDIVALAIWRERELGFPPRARLLNPDAIDRETRAWAACLREARAAIAAYEDWRGGR